MDSENQIVTKITADITGLKQGVSEAKQALNDFQGAASQGLVVNWEGGSGSVEEFNKALAQSKAEWEEYQAQQQAAAEAMAQTTAVTQENVEANQENAESTTQLAESQNVLSFALDKVKSAFNTMKETAKANLESIGDAFNSAKDYAKGYVMRMNEATESNALLHTTTRTARSAILLLQAAMLAYSKSSLEEYANSNSNFAATQERVNGAINELKRAFGAVLASLYPLVDGFTQWLVQNKQLVTTLATAAAGIVAAGAAVQAFSYAVATAKALTSGWVGVLSLVAGVAAAAYVSTIDLSSGISDNSDRIAELQNEIADLDGQIAKAEGTGARAGNNTAKQINKVKDQLADLNFEFNQQLKQIAVNHDKTLQELTRQIEEENFEYKRAIDERRAEFEVEQAKEAEEHQDKVDELTKQINFLQRYNNKYNKEKLEQLKYALEKENKLYEIRTQKEQEELDIQIANEEAAHQAKLESLQAELDDELAFQNKHREALNGVRDVILLDEIESLQRQHEAQLASYQEQLSDAMSAGYANGSTYSSSQIQALKDKRAAVQAELDELTNADAIARKNGQSAATNWYQDFTKSIENWLRTKSIFKDFWNSYYGGGFESKTMSASGGGSGQGWATGGYTGYGEPDEIAGLVHKGEYVLRADQVDQSTGTPKNMGNNITINVSGTFATSASERRKVAEQIANALGQVQKARLM